MGHMLIHRIAGSTGCRLAGASERAGSAAIGRDAGTVAGLEPAGVLISDDPAAPFRDADVVIDFTSPEAALIHAALAAEYGKALVLGTTGLSEQHFAALAVAARKVPVVQSPNMSLGVNLLLGLVEQAAARLGNSFDAEILEMHHRHKVDAPSGTALALGRAVAAGRGVDHDEVAVRSRDGYTGARETGAIGYAVLRGGDVVGDHTVIFADDGERLELSHRASGRHIFAAGAVRAAMWTRDRPPGLYGMRDVLGL